MKMTEKEFSSLIGQMKKKLNSTAIAPKKPRASKKSSAKKENTPEARAEVQLGGEDSSIEATPKKKTLGIEVKENIINYNKKCVIEVSYDTEYISIIFKNAKLLSTNQIFQILQYRKFEIFAYKKMWQEIVQKSLSGLENLPVFEDNCELVLFRQSKRLVDNDSMGVMFKYIIDALRYNKKEPGPYVISEDNPNVVENIKFLQIKDAENIVGIRLQRIKKNNMRGKTVSDFMKSKSL